MNSKKRKHNSGKLKDEHVLLIRHKKQQTIIFKT